MNDDTWSITTVDGKKHNFYTADGAGSIFNIGEAHVFAITDITGTTVTFANPWDSSKTYTVTWEEFINMQPSGVEWVTFAGINEPEENEFYYGGETYNIDDILNSNNSEYIQLTKSVRDYDNAAEDAIMQLELLIQNIKENLTGYDADRVDLACQTLLNYYKAAIQAATIRDGNGNVGKEFSYFDALNNTMVTCSDTSVMRSAWDHKDVNSGEDIDKKCNDSETGIYIGHDKERGGGHDNDKFYIYLDINQIIKQLMSMLS